MTRAIIRLFDSLIIATFVFAALILWTGVVVATCAAYLACFISYDQLTMRQAKLQTRRNRSETEH